MCRLLDLTEERVMLEARDVEDDCRRGRGVFDNSEDRSGEVERSEGGEVGCEEVD